MIKGVITGDIINSSEIDIKWRQSVIDSIYKVIPDLSSVSSISIEMFRGDSFQAVVEDAEQVLSAAIAIRTSLKASTPENEKMWDARVSIGIGDIAFESNKIGTSDGEAFRLSGRAFDNIAKSRLVLVSPWTDFNESINLNTRFADDLITSLTSKQAKVVYKSILAPKKQKDMAEELGMTRQNFNYLWTSSRGQLILDYIAYFKTLIRKKLSCQVLL